MKYILAIVLLAVCVKAEERLISVPSSLYKPFHTLTEIDAHNITAAIWRAEGGHKARKPYGVLSVYVRDESEAYEVCLTTVKRTHLRWVLEGRPGHFLHFLADRYCPAKADPKGNRNWKRNIRLLMRG